MKLITLLVLLIAIIFCASGSENDGVIQKRARFSSNALIQQLFEMLRNVIRNGDHVKNIPSSDPYKFAYVELHLPGRIFNIQANVTQGTINGLGDFEVLKSDFNKEDLTVDLDIHFPMINFEAAHYEMKGSIFHDAIPLSGIGLLQFTIHDFNFCGKFYLKQSEDEKAIQIEKIENSHFTVDSITSRTQYDDNFDEIFNAMIEDLLAGYLTRFNGYLIHSYGNYVIEVLNRYFAQFDSWRIMTLII